MTHYDTLDYATTPNKLEYDETSESNTVSFHLC
jgi:hypothetical protein